MTTETGGILLSCLLGIAVGLVYFGGLWLTVRRLPTSPNPSRLWAVSYALRLAVLLLGVWPVLQQARQTPVAPFAGMACILAVRLMLTRLLGPRAAGRQRTGPGSREAGA